MDEQVLGILLSWAVFLSGYSKPVEPPELRYEPHAFFVENVCGGKECKAEGWYNDNDIVYIDEKHKQSGSVGDSLAVHEFVHYLQHKSGEFKSTCADHLKREDEAYMVQDEYLAQATTIIYRARFVYMGCKEEIE